MHEKKKLWGFFFGLFDSEQQRRRRIPSQALELIMSTGSAQHSVSFVTVGFLPLSSIVTVKTFVNSNHVEYFGRWLLNLKQEVGGSNTLSLLS